MPRPRLEVDRPEVAEEALDRLTDPFFQMKQIAQDLAAEGKKGISKALAGFINRLEKSGAMPAIERGKQIKRERFVEKLEQVTLGALESIDEWDLANASFKDKMIGIGIGLEKRAMLLGEPTAILSVEERTRLPDLIAAGLKELERRGMAIELTKGDYSVAEAPPEVRVLPPDRMQEEALSATARRMRGLKRRDGE